MDILTYINKMNRLYGSEQLVAGRPSGAYGIQDTYSAPDDTPIPNWRDLIREEGVQVGPQVKDGGRIYDTRKYFKPGGLVEPGVTHYGTNPMTGSPAQQARNIKAQKETWNKIAEAMLKADTTGDFEYLMDSPEKVKKVLKANPTRKKIIRHKKGMMDGSMRNAWLKLSTDETGLRHIANKLKLDVDRVLDIMEETKDFSNESRTLTHYEKKLAESSKIRSQFAEGEKWMLANGHRYNDPTKFKADYIKRFGRSNAFIKAMKNKQHHYFSSAFNVDIMGAKSMVGEGSKLSTTLGDNVFSSVIYNMNDKVRNAITTEFERALTGDVPTVKYQARKILTQSPLLKKFGLDKKIHGPISRLIFKEVGDKMYENIQTFRQPRTTTWGFLNYLEDVVDPKYKTQFAEARKAVDYATRNKWKDAKKVLNIADNINWDHKIPSFLIDAGYADELEYAKLQPTTEHFNMKIKNAQFDRPMANLMEEWKKAPASQKANVITKMQDKIDDFSRKYGGYMEGVKVAPDKTGKPIFTSQAGPFTKKTDVVKSLKTSLAQEKFPTMNKNQQRKFIKLLEQGPEGIKFLNKQATAQTMWKIIGDKGGKICSTGLVKKAGGGRIGFAEKKCGLAFATEKPTEYMAAVKKNKEALNAFKVASTGKDTSKVLKAARWVMRDLGNPVGWIGSELIISGGITAAMLGEGYTTRESIDQGLAWFLPKSVLKAELHKIRDMAEKENVPFEQIMPFLELESIAEEYDKHKMAHLKNTDPLYAWDSQELYQMSFSMFGKKLEDLTEEELKQIPMPSASGRGGNFYRKQAIDSSVLGMGSANKKYSDLLKKIQKPFGKDDLRYALPYSQLDELRNVADMAQTEKAKANDLAALKSQYDRGMQYTAGRGKPQTFEEFVHKQGKGDLFFNEFQRGPDRREMLTWSLFNDTGVEPYKMPFPEKAPIDFSAAPYEEGGRVPFKLGGIDKGRRAFMKWLAGITGAGIAAGTGLIKWGVKKGTGKTVIKAGDHIIQGTPGMPDWYIPLINRIVKEGDDVTKKLGTVEREIVHTKKISKGEEVTVYQNLDTGNVRVEYNSPNIMGEGSVGPVQLEYRAGEVITEGQHAGKKTKSEFEAMEPEPVGHTHGRDDYSIEWDGENVVGRVEDLTSDTSKLKEFGTKKNLTHKDKIIAKKKKKAVQKVHENESDYIVEKQGDYYDNYLPDIDDID